MELNITGKKFNKLTTIKFICKNGHQNRAKWLFRCDCGNEKILDKGKVTGGYTKSCNCLMIKEQERFVKNATTHSLSGGRSKKRPEYNAWVGIKRRCLNVNDASYHNYGGRGIKVCNRWKDSFKNFWDDMGKRPSKKHSIDRINNDGNYEPNNCRWATDLQQMRNKRGLRLITIDNQTKCLTEWAEHLNLDINDVNRDLYERKIDVIKVLRGGDKK